MSTLVDLTICLFWLVIIGIPAWICWSRLPGALRNDPEVDNGRTLALIIGSVGVALGLLGVFIGIGSVNWLALVDPTSALAMKVLR